MGPRFPIPTNLRPALVDLQCEVETLREDVQAEAEAAGLNKAITMPMDTRRRLAFLEGRPALSTGRGREFRLEQDEHGVWQKGDGWTSYSCGDPTTDPALVLDKEPSGCG